MSTETVLWGILGLYALVGGIGLIASIIALIRPKSQ